MHERAKVGYKGVNFKVDMRIELVSIISVSEEWEKAHKIRALEIDKKSPALAGLLQLQKKHPSDHRKILKVIRLVAENHRVTNEKHVKQCQRHGEVYEMRGGDARLLFFYSPSGEDVVICTNTYWKAKASRSEQNATFDRCWNFREIYLRSL